LPPLIIVPSLEDVPAGPELRLVAAQLSRVVTLDRADGPNALAMRDAGVTVVGLDASLTVDVGAWRTLRDELRTHSPALIHVFGLFALRLAVPAGAQARILFTDLGERPGWLDRRLPRRVHSTAVRGEGGIPFGPLIATKSELSPSAEHRLIAADGVFDRRDEWRTALRAFDFLKLIYPDVRFDLSGAGPLVAKLDTFVRRIGGDDIRTRFVGRCHDLPSFYGRAFMAWVPSAQPGAAQRALTAMAAGRAVVAVRCPETEAVVRHEETGFLYDAGDVIPMTRFARRLVENADVRSKMESSARQYVAEHFPTSRVVDGFAAVYDHEHR